MSARDISSLAVGAVGGFFFGPAGFAIGAAIGAALVPEPGLQGPRLQDLNVQTSTYGAPIPVVYGATRLAGNVIWARPLRERSHSQGGGKGGGPSYTTYSYFGTFAVGLCEGPIVGIRRIWFDTVLVYDVGENASAESLIASGRLAERITVYPGDEDQEPDPLMEASEGMGQVPAYRGVAYIVVDDLPLEKYGNRIPNVTVEVVRSGDDLPLAPVATFALSGDTSSPNRMGYDMDIGQAGTLFGMEDGVSNAPDGVFRQITFSPDLDPVRVDSVYWTSDPEGGPHLRLVAGNREWQVGVGAMCKLYRHGQFVCSLTPSPTTADSWYSGGSTLGEPEDAGLIWVRGGRLYIGVRRRGSGGGIPWNRILSWPLPPIIDPAAASALSPDGRAVALYQARDVDVDEDYPYFCVYVSRDGQRVYAINSESLLRIYDRDLQVIDTMDVSGILPVAPAAIAIEDGILHALVGGSLGNTRWYRAWRMDDGALIAEFDYIGSGGGSGSKPNRIVTDGRVAYVLRNATVRAFALSRLGVDGVSLSAIVADICARAGMPAEDIDVTALQPTVRGYTITRPMPARAALEPLQQTQFFDAPEREGRIVFTPRGGSIAATIQEDDLAAHGEGETKPDAFPLVRAQDAELPRRVTVEYQDIARDYQAGVQHASRITTAAVSEQEVRLPIVLDADQAAAVAQVLLYDAWHSRERATLRLPAAQYIALHPADVIHVPYRGRTWALRIVRAAYAVPGLLEMDVVRHDPSVYQAVAAGGIPPLSTQVGVGLAGPTLSELLDIALLRDDDDPDGVYVAGAGVLSGWQGAAVLVSHDGGASYQTETVIPEASVMGVADTVLESGPYTIVDRANTVTVTVSSGTLESTTEAQLLNGANAALLGQEVIQFQTAELVSGRTYTLSGLVRGRRGTEWARGAHSLGERFILLSTALARFTVQEDRINSSLLTRVVSVGEDALTVDPVPLAYAGRAHMPYAPAHLTAVAQAAGDFSLTWQRRTRIGGEWRDYVDARLGEEFEAYRVRVRDGEYEVSSHDVESRQATVFALDGMDISVQQLSAVVGPGHAATVTAIGSQAEHEHIDFSGAATGAGVPAGWTQRLTTTGITFEVIEDGAVTGGKYLRATPGASAARALSLDDLDDVENLEMAAVMRVSSILTSGFGHTYSGLVLRGSGSGSTAARYAVTYRLGGSVRFVQLTRTSGGATAQLATYNIAISSGQWFALRARVVGSTLRAKVWLATDPEPQEWQIVVTDPDPLPPGWAGLYYGQGSRDYDADVFDHYVLEAAA